jgi:hypothetical protein
MARSHVVARRWARRVLPVFLVGAALSTFGVLSTAGAGVQGSPSDPRATFEPGNPNTCEEAGTPASNVLSVDPPVDASDGNVSGDVSDYDPNVDNPPGVGPEEDATKLNVTILNPSVVIVGVIVKGGPNANVYPTNVPNMISPFNNGGNIPAISHWLVCYNFGGPPPPNGNGGNGAGNGDAAAAEQARAAAAVRAQAQFTG